MRKSLALMLIVSALFLSGCNFMKRDGDAMKDKKSGEAMMEDKGGEAMEDGSANGSSMATTKASMRVLPAK